LRKVWELPGLDMKSSVSIASRSLAVARWLGVCRVVLGVSCRCGVAGIRDAEGAEAADEADEALRLLVLVPLALLRAGGGRPDTVVRRELA
jgi:hypothetical protein